MLTVILPTYNEAENLPMIVPEIAQTCRASAIDFEVLVVDDGSPDGTAEVARRLSAEFPVRVHCRNGTRGLSASVVDGFGLARGSVCLVMDADMSHPVDKIPAMVKPILDGEADAVVGSRYVEGGGATHWPLLRRLVSRGSGLLARGVTTLSDPTSGFMAIRRSTLDGVELDPIGWKIVLETVVKTRPRIAEVPIVFTDRIAGESKLDLRSQLAYLVHLWRLYGARFPRLMSFVKFCTVGLSGLLVDTVALVAAVEGAGLDPRGAAVIAFSLAVTWNYGWNRVWTFSGGKALPLWSGWLAFVLVCLFGLGIRIGVMHVLIAYLGFSGSYRYVLASVIGILVATTANFLASRALVFERR